MASTKLRVLVAVVTLAAGLLIAGPARGAEPRATAPEVGEISSGLIDSQFSPEAEFTGPLIIDGLPTHWVDPALTSALFTTYATLASPDPTVAAGRVTYLYPDGSIAVGPLAMTRAKNLLGTSAGLWMTPSAGWVLGLWTARVELLDVNGNVVGGTDLTVNVRDPSTARTPKLLELRNAKKVITNSGVKVSMPVNIKATILDPDHVVGLVTISDQTLAPIPPRLRSYCNSNGHFDYVDYKAKRDGDVLLFTWRDEGCNVAGRHRINLMVDSSSRDELFGRKIRGSKQPAYYRVKHTS